MSNDMWAKSEVVRLLRGAPGTQYQEANDTNKAIIRDWVRGLLQKDAVTIVFVKADGTEREMLCTLNWDLIPVDKQPGHPPIDGKFVKESKSRKDPDPHSLRVFDVAKQEWRSFRFDRLKKVVAELSFQ